MEQRIRISELQEKLIELDLLKIYPDFMERVKNKEPKSWIVSAESTPSHSCKIRTYDGENVIIDIKVLKVAKKQHATTIKTKENQMLQYIEMTVPVVDLNGIQSLRTKEGKWLYYFGVPITSTTETGELISKWLRVAIFQDSERKDLIEAKNVHFVGTLKVREASRSYPKEFSIFGSYIEPVSKIPDYNLKDVKRVFDMPTT